MSTDTTERSPRTPYEPPAASDTQRVDHASDTQRVDHGVAQPPPPPPAAPERSGGGRDGLPMRSYLAVALTAALAAGAVVVPTQLLDDEPAGSQDTTAASVTGTSNSAEEGGGQTDVTPLPGASDGSQIAAIAERVLPSTVRINVGQGSGSGIVYDGEGRILTNAHVVQDADQVEVVTPDGDTLDGTVLGRDPTTDVALVEVDRNLPVPQFATEEPGIGELTVAIGSPFGLEGSVTSGIVSGLGRTLPGSTLTDLIQTDAAINPGNSGGALTNGAGQIIGINTAILSPSGANDGVGFAVPTATAQQVAGDIIEFGEVRAGFLGIEGQTVPPEIAETYDLGVDEGVVVRNVQPDSPADDAGLEQGDLIVELDGEAVPSMAQLAATVQAREPGETITLGIVRDGEQTQVDLTLGERPN